MQAQHLGLRVLRCLAGQLECGQSVLHIGMNLPCQPVRLQPCLQGAFKGMAPAHGAGVPHGQLLPSQGLQGLLGCLQLLCLQPLACRQATGLQLIHWPAQVGLQGLRLQGGHSFQTQFGLHVDRGMRRQIHGQVRGQLLRQRLGGHARTDALPQSLQCAIGLQLRFVSACACIPERQLLLHLTGTAPIAHLCHALTQLGSGLGHGQNIPTVRQRLTCHHRVDPKPLHIQAHNRRLLPHSRQLCCTHARLEPQGLVLQGQAHGQDQRQLPGSGMRGWVWPRRHVLLFPAQQVHMATRELTDSPVGVLPSGD